MKQSARDVRAAYVAELHKQPPVLSLDLRKKYQIDTHESLWTSKDQNLNKIEIRKGVNIAMENALRFGYAAMSLHRERVIATSKALKAIQKIVENKSHILAVDAYELALGGQLWGTIPRFHQVKPEATEAYKKVQELVLAAERALTQFPPPNPDPIKNHDYFTQQFLLGLSALWRARIGRPPARSSEGPFIRFATDAWQDLGLKAIDQHGNMPDEIGSWLGSKWPTLSRDAEKLQKQIQAIFPQLKAGDV